MGLSATGVFCGALACGGRVRAGLLFGKASAATADAAAIGFFADVLFFGCFVRLLDEEATAGVFMYSFSRSSPSGAAALSTDCMLLIRLLSNSKDSPVYFWVGVVCRGLDFLGLCFCGLGGSLAKLSSNSSTKSSSPILVSLLFKAVRAGILATFCESRHSTIAALNLAQSTQGPRY